MDTDGFQLDKTLTSYRVNPQKATKESASSSVIVRVSHTHRRGFYVRTDDGDFHVKQDQERFRAFKPFTMDSSLFTLQDSTSLKSRICQALAAAMVRPEVQEAIMNEMIAEGIKMVKGYDRVGGTIAVDVVTRQNFICFEVVGEN